MESHQFLFTHYSCSQQTNLLMVLLFLFTDQSPGQLPPLITQIRITQSELFSCYLEHSGSEKINDILLTKSSLLILQMIKCQKLVFYDPELNTVN